MDVELLVTTNNLNVSKIGFIQTYAVECAIPTNGTLVADKTLATAGEIVTLTATPTTDGYLFGSWSVTYNDGTEKTITPDGDGKFTMPAYPVSVSATFYHPYVVTYNANGGECATASANYEGTALILPEASNSPLYFVGWYDAAENGNKIGTAGDEYTPTANITLFAHWSETEPTSLDNTTDEINAIKRIENGQLIIEKNGVRYNAQGQLIR